MCTRWRALLIPVGAAFWSLIPLGAAAQTADQPYHLANGRITFGGEIAAAISSRDAEAFFNYTDYEQNALRLARVRLFSEWRIGSPLSVVLELRTENADDLDVAALYARWRPWAAHEFDIQAGRIPPVVGAFARRAYGRDNPLIGSPLAYQYLTLLRPDALPYTFDDVLRMRGRGWRPTFPVGDQTLEPGVPLLATSRWDTGVEVRWRRDWIELAAALTRGSPSIPVVEETNSGRQLSARVATHFPAGITVGVSGARGQWLESSVLSLVPEALRDRSMQSVVAADLEIGIGRWLARAEVLRSTFELPFVGEPQRSASLSAWSGFVEGRYRLHPRWQLAMRTERLGFDRVADPSGARVSWDAPVTRIEAVVGFRASRKLELRGGWQHNWREGGRVRDRGYPALQAIYWF